MDESRSLELEEDFLEWKNDQILILSIEIGMIITCKPLKICVNERMESSVFEAKYIVLIIFHSLFEISLHFGEF